MVHAFVVVKADVGEAASTLDRIHGIDIQGLSGITDTKTYVSMGE